MKVERQDNILFNVIKDFVVYSDLVARRNISLILVMALLLK